MASPYTISRVQDVGIGATENIIQGLTGRTLVAPSRVQIALNRENVNVSFTVLVGAERVMLDGGARVNPTAGDLPILPDDLIIDTFGRGGDEIVINANNADAAASEARVIIKVTELDDVALQRAMNIAQGAQRRPGQPKVKPMTVRGKPNFQETVASMNDRVGVATAGGGIKAISDTLQVVVGANDAIREVRWTSFEHDMIATANFVATFPPVPQGEAHKYLHVGTLTPPPTEGWDVFVLYPTAGILPIEAVMHVAQQTALQPSLLAKLDADDGPFGHESQPLIVYPAGRLRIRTTSDIAIGSKVNIFLVWEILAAPVRTAAQLITPVITEVQNWKDGAPSRLTTSQRQ